MGRPARSLAIAVSVIASLGSVHLGAVEGADDRYHSDSDARYLHHINLYDVDNRKITPESTRPFSSLHTCGRCHDYETISHGWHFNAFQPETIDGRQGEPWIWTDPKTGTQLPLSYRDWPSTYSPPAIGISKWEMTLQFGARIPGGNMGSPVEATPDSSAASDSNTAPEVNAASDGDAEPSPATPPVSPVERWNLTGSLEIDCMVCHAVSGAYDFGERRRQINEENFAWAPTAALRLGTVEGRVSTIKEGSDPEDEATQKKMPVVTYDPARFGQDGTVFMDLIRKPSNNACYQCHSNRMADEDGIEPRWIHDQDVHLRAGMDCVDCHRNGIDHHIVRGFVGEEHPARASIGTLSCTGCHYGEAGLAAEPPPATSAQVATSAQSDPSVQAVLTRAGRMGAPTPAHAGLPPLHFEKLACTACHGGPVPQDQARRILTSLAHGLGERGHRSGQELPAMVAPVFAKADDGRVTPHRAMWPAFWGSLQNGKVVPLPPNEVYDLTRRSLRVRSDFVEEILQPKVSSSDLKELLGEDRAAKADDWSAEERAKVEAFQAEQGQANFAEKVHAALQALATERNLEAPVYVSSGRVYARGDQEGTLQQVEVDDPQATSMILWPMAHNVRPAGWALGAGGCTDCHSDSGKLFTSTVAAVGPGPDRGEPLSMAALQGVDPDQQLSWNEMFRSRANFKYLVAASIGVLLMVICVGIGAIASRLAGRAT